MLRRLVLDVLKPHEPDIAKFSQKLSKILAELMSEKIGKIKGVEDLCPAIILDKIE